MTGIAFYDNDVLVENFDFGIVAEPEMVQQFETRNVTARLLRTVAAITVSAVAVFGPCSASSAFEGQGSKHPVVDRVVVHVDSSPEASRPAVGFVPIPSAHQASAERFRKMFKAVPLTAAEKLPDPDFGL